MERPRFINGYLHAPYFIYFRREPQLTDAQILELFGLTHKFTPRLKELETYAVLADIGEWTMLADDWLYQLWGNPSTLTAIESLAKTRDVFAWWLGNIDQSFEYKLYRNGELVRQYTVESPNFDDQIVRVKRGEFEPYELALLASDLQIYEKMSLLCGELGIDSAVTYDQLRLYAKPFSEARR